MEETTMTEEQKRQSESNRLAALAKRKALSDHRNPPPLFKCIFREVSEDLNHWQATIMGPDDSPYAGGLFLVNIDIPPEYPFDPPRVAYKEKVFHPNISDGIICLDIFGGKWSPALSIYTVLSSIYSLLMNPDPENPLVPEVAELYMEKRKLFDALARSWTQKYAMG